MAEQKEDPKETLTNLSTEVGLTPSSFVTLAIPTHKFCL